MRIPAIPRGLRITLLFPSLLTLACVAEDEALLDEEASDEIEDADEELDDEFRVQYLAMLEHAEVVQDDAPASKATGVISVPFLSPTHTEIWHQGYRVRGTCGVTFVSPHYAITAAHCVSATNVPHPQSQQLWVTTFDFSAMSPFAVGFASAIEGLFPHYEAIVDLRALPGYQASSTLCKVVSRCKASFGQYNCNSGHDIAMLHCPSRASNAGWLPIAANDPGTGPVEMYWFHEVLHVPTSDPGNGDLEWRDKFLHYTPYDQNNRQNNFHYLESYANAIVPLRSKPWTGGTLRSRTGGNWTDMFGCHGTSGSGVLQRNAAGNLELLGPVEFGGFGNSLLCANPDTIDIGHDVVSYTSHAGALALQSQYQFALFWDRNPIVFEPWPPPVLDPG